MKAAISVVLSVLTWATLSAPTWAAGWSCQKSGAPMRCSSRSISARILPSSKVAADVRGPRDQMEGVEHLVGRQGAEAVHAAFAQMTAPATGGAKPKAVATTPIRSPALQTPADTVHMRD